MKKQKQIQTVEPSIEPPFKKYENQLIPRPEQSFASAIRSPYNILTRYKIVNICIEKGSLMVTRKSSDDGNHPKSQDDALHKLLPGTDFLALIDGNLCLMHANWVFLSYPLPYIQKIEIDVNTTLLNDNMDFARYVSKYLDESYISSYVEMKQKKQQEKLCTMLPKSKKEA